MNYNKCGRYLYFLYPSHIHRIYNKFIRWLIKLCFIPNIYVINRTGTILVYLRTSDCRIEIYLGQAKLNIFRTIFICNDIVVSY